VYQIDYDFPRFGNIVYSVENPNTGKFAVVHRETLNNKNIVPSIANPSFPIYASAMNSGNTTDLSVVCSTMCGFVEGVEKDLGPNFSTGSTVASEMSTAELPIFTLRNKLEFQGQVNATRLMPKLLTLVSNLKDDKENTTFRFYLGATPLNGTVYTDVNSEASTAEVDITSTEFDDEGGAISAQGPIVLGSTDASTVNLMDFESIMPPGVPLVVTGQSSKGVPGNFFGASISWSETV
jgi:hypothetical protein